MKRPSQSAALAFRLEGIAEFAEGATVPVSVQLLREAAATLRAQAEALAERGAEVERLREALEFYADEGNLDAAGYGRHMLPPQPGAYTSEPDRGQTARQALTPTQEGR